MSTVNAFEQAAIPTARAIVAALKVLFASLGSDPTQWPLKADGAAKVFLGTVELQLPVLANAEAGAGVAQIATTLDSWDAKLAAAQTPAA